MQPRDPSGATAENAPDAGAGPAPEPTRLSGVEDSFGFHPAGGKADRADGDLPPGTNLGGVTLIRLVAVGGMGRVYEGTQDAPSRTVAVKVMLDGLLSATAIRRFEYEAEVLARLRHPGIAQIYTFGTHVSERGPVPFFVMEFVAGAKPVTQYAVDERLPVRRRVELFRRICSAVAHGHQKGVIHRDIKPGNVLVDAGGEPKIIDFGVARSLDADRLDATALTQAGDIVGTLRYMSPEQLGLEGEDVDARSDVYALGLLLHELLVGSLPYDLRGRSVLEAVRLLDDARPTPDVVEPAVMREGLTVRREARSLATIVGRCLEKRRVDRYATAFEVEAELGRWLAGEPILASPPTAVEGLIRLARRHRSGAVAAVVILVSLLGAMIGIGIFSVRADRQRLLAVEARRLAEQRERDAEAQAAVARAQLYLSNVLLAAEARDRDNVGEARRRLAAAESLVGDAGTPHPTELFCLAATLDESVRSLEGHTGMVTAVAWSPDGSLLATGGVDGTIRVQRRPTRLAAASPIVLDGHGGPVWGLSFSADGLLLASASGDHTVRVHDMAGDHDPVVLAGHGATVYSVAFSPDGAHLLSASRDRTARLWSTATWTQDRILAGHGGTVYCGSFSPDGQVVATSSLDRSVRLWDVASGAERACLDGHGERVFHVGFSPDGSTLASASQDGTVRLWDADAARTRLVLHHPVRVNAAAFVAGGDRLATASGDGVVRLWSTTDGREIMRLRGHEAAIWTVACLPDGTDLATGSADCSARIWDTATDAPPVMRCPDKVTALALSPDGGLIATGLANSSVHLWDSATLRPRGVLGGGGGSVKDVKFAPDGGMIVGGREDGTAGVWPVGGGDPTSLPLHEKQIYGIDISPDGRLLATASEDRTARLWDLVAGKFDGAPLRHARRVYAVAFSPDGTRLATACEDRIARLWNVAGGVELLRFPDHDGSVNWVDFSPDGRLLATASSDGAVRLWNTGDGTLVTVLTGPSRQIWKAAFSPDGGRIAAVSADGTAQLWDVASGRAAPLLRGHRDQVWGLAFSADGRGLVTSSWDGTARLWGVAVAEIERRRQQAE